MELKITISGIGDSTSVEIDGAQTTQPVSPVPVGGQPSADAPPADILRAAAATGAMNAGRAPSFTNLADTGAPPAFITGSRAEAPAMNISPEAHGASPDLAAGAAPGSGAMAETFSLPESDS